jgi:predicted ATPase
MPATPLSLGVPANGNVRCCAVSRNKYFSDAGTRDSGDAIIPNRLDAQRMLKTVTLLRERVAKWDEYPFAIPAIASLDTLRLTSAICFFVGENGTGKSTLLEALANHYGFGREGGNRNFVFETTASVRSTDSLAKALRLAFTVRTGSGFYLRAESFFNVASHVDAIGVSDSYGGASLHAQSHGESFITLLRHKFKGSGFYLMDEPEAALSPQRQLSFLALLHDVLSKKTNAAQFLIATHSPILLAYPGAQIFSFDGGRIHEISYRESQPFQLVSRFLAAPERYVDVLFAEDEKKLD